MEDLQHRTPSRPLISYHEEVKERFLLCKFILDLGIKLKLYDCIFYSSFHSPQSTITSAQVFLHRFFMRRALIPHDKKLGQVCLSFSLSLQLLAIACLYLAGKVEETPHKIKEILTIYFDGDEGLQKILLDDVKVQHHRHDGSNHHFSNFKSYDQRSSIWNPCFSKHFALT